jgi:GNAT superfamily N-acetyltransferase
VAVSIDHDSADRRAKIRAMRGGSGLESPLSGVHIRPATVADAGALASVHLNTVLVAYAGIVPPNAPPSTKESLVEEWEAAFEDPSLKAFLAEDHGEPVGTVAVRADPEFVGFGQMRRLYVLPGRWGRGAGSALHDAALAALEDDGYPEAGLWVLEANARARHFYERRGWRRLVPDTVLEWPGLEIFEVRYRLVMDG